MKRHCTLWTALSVSAILLAASLLPTRAFAQGTDSALVRGAVTDSTGASIPGAAVNMTNDGTKIPYKATTDQTGRYIFQVLKPASYTATVESQGFKTVERKNIILRVGDQTGHRLTLQVGSGHPEGRNHGGGAAVEHGQRGAGHAGDQTIPH